MGAVLDADPDLAGASAVVLSRLVRRGPRQGEATACGALRDFDPHRLVPLDAFLYRRVVEAVWTRHRQECSFGRCTRPGEAIPDRPAPERPGPDADTLARMDAALGSLAELDRGLIRQLFWDGRCEDDLAREWGSAARPSANVNKRYCSSCGGRWGCREESTGKISAIFDARRLRIRSSLHFLL